jgi:2-iminobutanoate/2-iminopropanoate deaminase
MKPLNPSTVMKPTPGHSQGVSVGDTVYVSGQVAVDAGGELVGADDIAAQTKQSLTNVRLVLESAGLDLSNVVSTTVYIHDMADYGGFSQAWVQTFGDHQPARATVRADLVHPALLVEIQAVAVR